MKRTFLFILAAITMACAFADSTAFFRNGRLVHTMYVRSLEGLRARDFPGLGGNRLCGLPNGLPVKIVALGEEAEIDGIKAPWVKILLPRYEWKSDEPRYGWVFGGYLSRREPERDLANEADFIGFLASKIWKKTGGSTVMEFTREGKYYRYRLAAGGGESGDFTVVSKDLIKARSRFYDEGGPSGWYTVSMKIEVVSDDEIRIDGETYRSYIDAMGKDIADRAYYLYGNYQGKSLYDFIFEWNPYNHQYTDEERNEIAFKLIQYGVDPKGSAYARQYEDYWRPIMEREAIMN